jgi:hypothetical protein
MPFRFGNVLAAAEQEVKAARAYAFYARDSDMAWAAQEREVETDRLYKHVLMHVMEKGQCDYGSNEP